MSYNYLSAIKIRLVKSKNLEVNLFYKGVVFEDKKLFQSVQTFQQ